MSHRARRYDSLGINRAVKNVSTRAIFHQLIPFSLLGRSRPFSGMVAKMFHWRSGPRLSRRARAISDDESPAQEKEELRHRNRVRLEPTIQSRVAESPKLPLEELTRGAGNTRKDASKTDTSYSKAKSRFTVKIQSLPCSPLYASANRHKSDRSTPVKISNAALTASRRFLGPAPVGIRVSARNRVMPLLKRV